MGNKPMKPHSVQNDLIVIALYERFMFPAKAKNS